MENEKLRQALATHTDMVLGSVMKGVKQSIIIAQKPLSEGAMETMRNLLLLASQNQTYKYILGDLIEIAKFNGLPDVAAEIRSDHNLNSN